MWLLERGRAQHGVGDEPPLLQDVHVASGCPDKEVVGMCAYKKATSSLSTSWHAYAIALRSDVCNPVSRSGETRQMSHSCTQGCALALSTIL